MGPFLSRLEAVIQNKPLLSHSFYTRWQKGELSMDELRGYAKEYYAFEKEFPRFLSAIHSRCENAHARKLLLENLIDEEQGDRNHPAMWLEFAEGVGVSRASVEDHFHSDETENLLRVFRKHSRSENVADGLSALYAYERQQPAVAETKVEGLRQFYGIQDDSTVAFFQAHQKYDVAHSQTEAALLEVLCQDPESQERSAAVVQESLDALYEFLDGVERRYRKAA
jgi:pyrroloquinoline-quinone synthase